MECSSRAFAPHELLKVIEVKSLAIEAVKVIRFGRFSDHRGYFTEHFRRSDFHGNPDLEFLHGVEFVQANESYSRTGTIRGLHFQWNPHMGKLLRTLSGRMVDMFLDVRKGSPTYGKIACYDMPTTYEADHQEWIWVPPGFAHGNFFTVDSAIEYFCTGEYSPGCEAGVSPFAPDIDWSLCDPALRAEFEALAGGNPLTTDKDRDGFTLEAWGADERSQNFVLGEL
jgi:dTDP-4-dehydrorhamnose 3,5-epimerase